MYIDTDSVRMTVITLFDVTLRARFIDSAG